MRRTTAGSTSASSSDDATVDTTAGTRGLKRRIYSTYVPFVSARARREQ